MVRASRKHGGRHEGRLPGPERCGLLLQLLGARAWSWHHLPYAHCCLHQRHLDTANQPTHHLATSLTTTHHGSGMRASSVNSGPLMMSPL